jgi:hypothetical protein
MPLPSRPRAVTIAPVASPLSTSSSSEEGENRLRLGVHMLLIVRGIERMLGGDAYDSDSDDGVELYAGGSAGNGGTATTTCWRRCGGR